MELNLTVNLADLDLGDVITRRYDNDTTVGEAVVAELVREIAKGDEYKTLQRRVLEIRDEEIQTSITALIADALSKPIVKTNSWGEPTGKETTLRDVIMGQVRTTLGLSTEDGYRDGRYVHSTTLEKLVRGQVNEALKTEIADAVKAAREAVAEEFGKSVSDVVTEAVRTGLRAR